MKIRPVGVELFYVDRQTWRSQQSPLAILWTLLNASTSLYEKEPNQSQPYMWHVLVASAVDSASNIHEYQEHFLGVKAASLC